MKMEFRENLSNHLTESLEPSQMLLHQNKNVMATKPKAVEKQALVFSYACMS